MAAKLAERETASRPGTPTTPTAHGARGDAVAADRRAAADGEARTLIAVLDPRWRRPQRDAALAELRKAQTSLGAFPWWPGGPPSPYMTLYILYGFSKALEFGSRCPKDVVQRAWAYMHRHYRRDWSTR
jgi:alpha-2-macroglobulin